MKYDDIINLPHHVSATRPRMGAEGRAAQFLPFAALQGFEELLRKEEGKAEFEAARRSSTDADGSDVPSCHPAGCGRDPLSPGGFFPDCGGPGDPANDRAHAAPAVQENVWEDEVQELFPWEDESQDEWDCPG